MNAEALMLVIHRSDCPALCQLPGDDCPHWDTTLDEHAHTCSAPTGEQLRELVEAAREVIGDDALNWALNSMQRLDAALEPFREEEKK